MERLREGKKMEKNRKNVLNKIYLIFLVFILIITLIFSFQSGKQMYYLINTNLNAEKTPVKSEIADWKFQVIIEY